MESFYHWMLRMNRTRGGFRDSRFGELARDMAGDKTFPREECGVDRLEGILIRRCRDSEALGTAKDALWRYRKRVLAETGTTAGEG